jgi:MinD-like ATPase involved in chromosome partitioning or flagellar assembly
VSTTEPEVALVFSPDRWVEDLHRYCVDHGGARIRCIVMEPAVALDEDYDVLVVSHRWPGLTAGFVDAVHARGRRVLGVVDPTEPAAARHLELVRVDRVVGSDVGPAELVAAVFAVAPDGGARRADPAAVGESGGEPPGPAGGQVVVVGGPPGGGRTEVAIELARRAAATGRATALVDADDVAPALATRLGLPIEPNLRSAIDAVEYGLGDLPDMLTRLAAPALAVLGGLPNVGAWAQLRPGEVLDVVSSLAAVNEQVVVDIAASLEDVGAGGRGRFAVGRALVEHADVLVGVGAGSPVGVVRLLAWAVDARALNPDAAVHFVVIRAPGDAFRRGEVREEVTRTFPAASLTFAGVDRRVERAAWEGELVAPGPFTKALAPLVATLGPAPTWSRSRAQRRTARSRRRHVVRAGRAVA